MKDSKETPALIMDPTPTVEIDLILKRVEELEGRFTQLETTLKDTVTFDTLVARLAGQKTVKKVRAKRELSPDEKVAFHARMVAGRLAKEKARPRCFSAKDKQWGISAAHSISANIPIRWRKEYGGIRIDQVRRLKELEKENTRLKKLVAELSLDNAILRETVRGN